ncbi:MAG: DNA mismatch repair endonuclease MutL, partial [Ktedonobacteraceae bacterium]
MPIRQLEPDVAAKIAAGEVVERPASVVKELIENSIDAGATQIRADLMSGGLQLIRVTDNGTGIPSDELQLALSRHATSKVARIDDLEHIRSLGFRGEALASIAAVAEVTLLSHHRGASQGAQVSATNGQISDVTTAASPGGTTVTVRNLFSAVPARLKFLKSRHTEVSHSHHLLEQYALAYPEIRFSVFNEGRQIFSTPGDGQLPSVLLEIYGLQITEQMVPISSLDGRDDDAERPVVSGFTSLPTCYKSTRQHMSFFVNRRWVLSRMLSYAVEEAYHSLLMAGRHPLAVVNISVDPTQIDVNVHPAKTEIRFLKERRVYAAVQRAVRQAILQDAHMPGWGNDTVISKQGAMNRAPTSNERLAAESIELDLDIEEEEEQFIASSNGEEAPAFPRDNPWITVTEEETGTKPPLLSRLWQSHVRQTDDAASRVSANRDTADRTPARGVPTFQDGDSQGRDAVDLSSPQEIAFGVEDFPNASDNSNESTMP